MKVRSAYNSCKKRTITSLLSMSLLNSLLGSHGEIQKTTNEQVTCPSKNRETSGSSGSGRRPSSERTNLWRCSFSISMHNEQVLYSITECVTCQVWLLWARTCHTVRKAVLRISRTVHTRFRFARIYIYRFPKTGLFTSHEPNRFCSILRDGKEVYSWRGPSEECIHDSNCGVGDGVKVIAPLLNSV